MSIRACLIGNYPEGGRQTVENMIESIYSDNF